MSDYLNSINSPEDLKKLSLDQRTVLCSELREFMIETVSKTGGHLASNLGIVELTVALHTVFNCPEDTFVFDVGHQSYVHKLLTGRTKDPALSMVKSIVHSLGYTLDDLDDTKKDIVFTNNSEGDIHKQKLLENYDLLNENAQHTLVEYSEFMVSKRENLKDNYNCDKMNA